VGDPSHEDRLAGGRHQRVVREARRLTPLCGKQAPSARFWRHTTSLARRSGAGARIRGSGTN